MLRWLGWFIWLAFAPGSGQSLVDVSSQGPVAPSGRQFLADTADFVLISR